MAAKNLAFLLNNYVTLFLCSDPSIDRLPKIKFKRRGKKIKTPVILRALVEGGEYMENSFLRNYWRGFYSNTKIPCDPSLSVQVRVDLFT